MPSHLQATVKFVYFTGCRYGAAEKIAGDMVAKDCSEIELSLEIVKNNEPLTLPLVDPLEEIAVALRATRKTFPKPSERVFCFRNFGVLWNAACNKLGLGTFDKMRRHYEGLSSHDFRRSAARNLIKAGVPRRYNIKTTEDICEALIKVGQFSLASVATIAEKSSTR